MINPEVSVVIPAYNSAEYIGKAIDSALRQNVSLEVIVINDNSSDNIEQVLSKYKDNKNFIYIKNEANVGVAKARNIGVNIAKGNYIAYLDADDWWEEEKLKKQLNLIKEKNCVLCYTARELVDERGLSTGKIVHVKNSVSYNQLIYHNSISCSSVLVKKEAALNYPMEFSEYHEDYITWLKILKLYGQAYGVNEPLLKYRLSKKGKSRKKISSAKMTFGVYRVMGMNKVKALVYTCSHLLHGIIKYSRKGINKGKKRR